MTWESGDREEPTFFNLSDDRARVPSPHGRTCPTALDPLYGDNERLPEHIVALGDEA